MSRRTRLAADPQPHQDAVARWLRARWRLVGVAIAAFLLVGVGLLLRGTEEATIAPEPSVSSSPSLPDADLRVAIEITPRILADAFGVPTAPVGIDLQGATTVVTIGLEEVLLSCQMTEDEESGATLPEGARAALLSCRADGELPSGVSDRYDFSSAVIGDRFGLGRPATVQETTAGQRRRIEIEGGQMIVEIDVSDEALTGTIVFAPGW